MEWNTVTEDSHAVSAPRCHSLREERSPSTPLISNPREGKRSVTWISILSCKDSTETVLCGTEFYGTGMNHQLQNK